MNCQTLFSGKNKTIFQMSSAEFAQREVKVNHTPSCESEQLFK